MADERTLSGARILVVEDDALVAMLIDEILTGEGCTVIGPLDRLESALAACRDESFDLALLDANVGGLKVYPVAEFLSSRGIPFMFLSGYGEDAVPPEHPEWKVCPKPFGPDALLRMLREQLATPVGPAATTRAESQPGS